MIVLQTKAALNGTERTCSLTNRRVWKGGRDTDLNDVGAAGRWQTPCAILVICCYLTLKTICCLQKQALLTAHWPNKCNLKVFLKKVLNWLRKYILERPENRGQKKGWCGSKDSAGKCLMSGCHYEARKQALCQLQLTFITLQCTLFWMLIKQLIMISNAKSKALNRPSKYVSKYKYLRIVILSLLCVKFSNWWKDWSWNWVFILQTSPDFPSRSKGDSLLPLSVLD